MLDRLRRALDHVDDLPAETQEGLAKQIEDLTHLAGHDADIPGNGDTLPGSNPALSLAARLALLREQIVAADLPLLSWEDVEGEVAIRRGERQSDERE